MHFKFKYLWYLGTNKAITTFKVSHSWQEDDLYQWCQNDFGLNIHYSLPSSFGTAEVIFACTFFGCWTWNRIFSTFHTDTLYEEMLRNLRSVGFCQIKWGRNELLSWLTLVHDFIVLYIRICNRYEIYVCLCYLLIFIH